MSLANFILAHLLPAPLKDLRTLSKITQCKEQSPLDAVRAVFSPLPQKNFVCTKAEKSHWVDLFVPENSIKIVIWLVGYFLLKPFMNEPFVSETWLPILGAVWVCLYVDIFACVCVCVCVCVSVCKRCTPLPRFCRHFLLRKVQSTEWMRLEGGKEREERRGTF